MTSIPPSPVPPAGGITELVESVRLLGERARLLAVNLAVVAAKLKKQGIGSVRLNEDILDLVSRVTRASQDVNDALKAMEQGRRSGEQASPGLWVSWQELGVPDERTLEQLTRSLNETLELSRYVFRWIRERASAMGLPEPSAYGGSDPDWADKITGPDNTTDRST